MSKIGPLKSGLNLARQAAIKQKAPTESRSTAGWKPPSRTQLRNHPILQKSSGTNVTARLTDSKKAPALPPRPMQHKSTILQKYQAQLAASGSQTPTTSPARPPQYPSQLRKAPPVPTHKKEALQPFTPVRAAPPPPLAHSTKHVRPAPPPPSLGRSAIALSASPTKKTGGAVRPTTAPPPPPTTKKSAPPVAAKPGKSGPPVAPKPGKPATRAKPSQAKPYQPSNGIYDNQKELARNEPLYDEPDTGN